jgi:thiamine-phosphate pyrophosphorylase
MPHEFYPIVPDAGWIARIVPIGVKSVQLRIKDPELDVTAHIAHALEVCARYDCELIVNDFWREAIECGARFVHLGQGDLDGANLDAIRAAGIRIGVSTHSEQELARALSVEPDHVALGPIYETKLKEMPWAPQGLPRIGEWKQRLNGRQLVAIGGITLERAPGVYDTGADSIAVVTDVIAHPEPERRVEQWLALAMERSKSCVTAPCGNPAA